jgi:hypothetical protein
MIKIQRNEKCPCGSGKKFKKCCFTDPYKNSEIERAASIAKTYEELTQIITQPLEVYQFKVKLVRMMFDEFKDEISRTIEIKGNQTLYDFHLEIQSAFDWDNDHMFSFYLGKELYDRENEYSANPFGEHIVSNIGISSKSATETQIRDLNLKLGFSFWYLFDYGDEIVHKITVKKIREIGSTEDGYPKIIKEIGKAPYPSGEPHLSFYPKSPYILASNFSNPALI